MKHLFTFTKHKAFNFIVDPEIDNSELTSGLIMEFAQLGFMPDADLIKAMKHASNDALRQIHEQIIGKMIKDLQGYRPLYGNFPHIPDVPLGVHQIIAIAGMIEGQDVVDELLGADDVQGVLPESSSEPQMLGFMSDADYIRMYETLAYSGDSLSELDKTMLIFAMNHVDGFELDPTRISFKETRAFVAQTYWSMGVLLTHQPNEIIRTWNAVGGGDTGLKELKKLPQPSPAMKRQIMGALNSANPFTLEDEFKSRRELWLKALFYLNPMSEANKVKYPRLYQFSYDLRNKPERLKTFASHYESAVEDKDLGKLTSLISRRSGYIARKFGHLADVFGPQTITKLFIDSNPSMKYLVSTYNYVRTRLTETTRSTILASDKSSQVSTYEGRSAWPKETVREIQVALRAHMDSISPAKETKVWIDPQLFFTPLQQNNRAASTSIMNMIAKGTAYPVPDDIHTIRLFVHWKGRGVDIDLSGFLCGPQGDDPLKVGWNGSHSMRSVVYSGDNRGSAMYNSEYIDINLAKVDPKYDWVIQDMRMYSGHRFRTSQTKLGWMLFDEEQARTITREKVDISSVDNYFEVTADSRSMLGMAYHIPSRSIITLDVSVGENNVSDDDLGKKYIPFIARYIPTSTVKWDELRQGHIIALAHTQVDDPEDADIIFDDQTPWERVAQLLDVRHEKA